MRYASILYRDYTDNSLFKKGAGENHGEFYLPYSKLREAFLKEGIELNTPDINIGRKVAFELHINCRRQNPTAPAFVYLYENPLIRPLNRDRQALSRYKKWFTWDGSLLDDARANQLFYPNSLEVKDWNPPSERNLFCVHVASNKALAVVDERDLYSERLRIINWYEKNAPQDFFLYGQGWNRPAAVPGRWGRVCNQLQKIFSRIAPMRPPFRTWQGPVEDKIALLQRARFCIAYENCRDLPGYVTEKLFDCFRAGCVPVYWGPREIGEIVPTGCFIDGRTYKTPKALDAFLRTIDDPTYHGYQECIRAFLISVQAKPFSQDHFAQVIVREILADLSAR
jgi:hypothetical protein